MWRPDRVNLASIKAAMIRSGRSAMAQVQPGPLSLVTSLLFDRPTCIDCISTKTGLSTIEVDRYLTVTAVSLQLRRSWAGCGICDTEGEVYALHGPVK